MELRKLKLTQYGPFRSYTIDFSDLESCILLTGKNNEGKSSIIFALRLIDSALRVINKRKQKISINKQTYYRLLRSDSDNINIGRLIHNYQRDRAVINAEFENDFSVTVFLDNEENLIYTDFDGIIPESINNLFGFMPTLGPLNEREELLSNTSYIRLNFRTSLAPRHLRNTLKQILSEEELVLVKRIIKNSWIGIELGDVDYVFEERIINVFFKEKNNFREIAWAGQGLQVWFQIIIHLVRLRNHKILILDEPEINLHPEKQNELIHIIAENFNGATLIATHSVELMNNVSVDHIINIKKSSLKPRIKKTSDRRFLESIRSQIGSNFNLIASQFEQCEIILFTENKFDYDILEKLAKKYGLNSITFNIPIHGFSEYSKAIIYKQAYEILIGNNVKYKMVLDRDYYPEDYLEKVKKELSDNGIELLLTPGKEIENILISKEVLFTVFSDFDEFEIRLSSIIEKYYDDSFGSLITLYDSFQNNKVDTKTLMVSNSPLFKEKWNDENTRFKIIPGKKVIKELRRLYRNFFNQNLTNDFLIEKINNDSIKKWIIKVFD